KIRWLIGEIFRPLRWHVLCRHYVGEISPTWRSRADVSGKTRRPERRQSTGGLAIEPRGLSGAAPVNGSNRFFLARETKWPSTSRCEAVPSPSFLMAHDSRIEPVAAFASSRVRTRLFSRILDSPSARSGVYDGHMRG